MKEVLELRNWTRIQSKGFYCNQHDGKFSFESAYLIAFEAYDDVPDSIRLYQQIPRSAGVDILSNSKEQYNPFPDIGGIILHENASKVLCKFFTSKADMKVETNM